MDSGTQPASTTEPISARAAAALLGVHERTIRRAIARGELPAAKYAGTFRIDRADLEPYRRRLGIDRQPAVPPRRTGAQLRMLPAPAIVWPQLPPALTPLIGREAEVAAVTALLQQPETRLLTLIGPGGVGKTRLAQQVAAGLRSAFEGQAGFVPLAPIRDPALVLVTIAQSFGMPEGDRRTLPGRLQALLGRQRGLLVLDNFEQVVAAAPAVAALLAACPELTVLVTSRARLRISGEQLYRVPPLALPSADVADASDAAAVRLFVARATAVRPDVLQTEDAISGIAAMCTRLDGLPLAIELAAARCNVLPPAALLSRLGPGLPLLTGGPRDQPVRLQTMWGAIAWSYDLLSAAEQAQFRRLAVFAGSFTLAAAAEISATPEPALLPDLTGLVEQSLLQTEAGGDAEPRYTMLETIREFGVEQLQQTGEAGETRRRHAVFYQVLAERIEPDLASPREGVWLDQLEHERPNLRAALRWYLETGDAAGSLRLAAALFRFWEIRGHLTEGQEWLRRALALPSEVSLPVRANALWRLSHLDLYLGEYDEARRHAAESLALAEAANDTLGEATAVWALGLIARFTQDLAAAQPHFERALALYRPLGDRLAIGKCLANLAKIAHVQGDLGRARALHDEALAVRLALGSRRELAYQYAALASLALTEHHLAEARELLALALALFAELGEELGYMLELGLLARIELAAGTPAAAYGPLVEMLTLYWKLQVREGLVEGLETVARAVLPVDGALAACLTGAVDADRARTHLTRSTSDRADWECTIASCRAGLGETGFARQRQRGHSTPLPDLIAEAETALRTLSAAQPAASIAAPPVFEPGVAPGDNLTPREREVLRRLATGQTNRQIAQSLCISPETAKSHVSRILAKLGVDSRTAAAIHARDRGLI